MTEGVWGGIIDVLSENQRRFLITCRIILGLSEVVLLFQRIHNYFDFLYYPFLPGLKNVDWNINRTAATGGHEEQEIKNTD